MATVGNTCRSGSHLIVYHFPIAISSGDVACVNESYSQNTDFYVMLCQLQCMFVSASNHQLLSNAGMRNQMLYMYCRYHSDTAKPSTTFRRSNRTGSNAKINTHILNPKLHCLRKTYHLLCFGMPGFCYRHKNRASSLKIMVTRSKLQKSSFVNRNALCTILSGGRHPKNEQQGILQHRQCSSKGKIIGSDSYGMKDFFKKI